MSYIITFLILSVMTTLRGLVTISELFAVFNLINTGIVNCLIRMHANAPFRGKNPKQIWGGGTAPFPDPFPVPS